MGRRCGYLTSHECPVERRGAMYINEESPSLEQIAVDADRMVASFQVRPTLFLTLVNESASQYYDREFLADVFNAESEGICDVRHRALNTHAAGRRPRRDRLLATPRGTSLRAAGRPVRRGDRGALLHQPGRQAPAEAHARSRTCSTTSTSRIVAPRSWLDLVRSAHRVAAEPDIEAAPSHRRSGRLTRSPDAVRAEVP